MPYGRIIKKLTVPPRARASIEASKVIHERQCTFLSQSRRLGKCMVALGSVSEGMLIDKDGNEGRKGI